MAPLTRMRSKQPGNIPYELNAKYYEQRASAGLIISEATQISQQGQGYPATPGIYSPEQIAGWKIVTNAVHKAGGKIVLQLWHVGRISHRSHQPEEQLRQGLAIDPNWGTNIDKVTTFKPQQGTWISEGIAAPHGSHSGGDYQGVIGTKNLPKSSIIRTDKLLNGFKQLYSPTK